MIVPFNRCLVFEYSRFCPITLMSVLYRPEVWWYSPSWVCRALHVPNPIDRRVVEYGGLPGLWVVQNQFWSPQETHRRKRMFKFVRVFPQCCITQIVIKSFSENIHLFRRERSRRHIVDSCFIPIFIATVSFLGSLFNGIFFRQLLILLPMVALNCMTVPLSTISSNKCLFFHNLIDIYAIMSIRD